MSKPSRKTHTPPPTQPPPPPKSRGLLVAAGVAVAAVLIAGTLYMQRSTAQPDTVAQAASGPLAGTALTPAVDAQSDVVLKPHPQTDFPPLRLPGSSLPRPAE